VEQAAACGLGRSGPHSAEMANRAEKSKPKDLVMTASGCRLKKKIALIYIDAGGGHRAAATALCEVIRQQRRPWDIQALCIQELFNAGAS
jgi:hypothetical protein